MHSVRLEINVDVAKQDITAQQVRSIIEAILQKSPANTHYLTIQSVKVVK